MTKTIFKTLILLVLMGATSCHKDEEEQTEQKTDYSSLFDYNVSLWVDNMTKDKDITLQLVYLNSYKREVIKANSNFDRTKIKAIELLKYFEIDMSDPYLENGEIRYFIISNKNVIKYGYLNKSNNLADIIIYYDDNGELAVTGTSQTHLD